MSARAIGALALWTTTVACTPEVPANPTYTNDVQPIFIAHCVRCHGAGDMLNAMLVNGRSQAPRACYLDRYETTGDCTTTPIDSAVCQMGAGSMFCAPMIPGRIKPTDASRMPPPPSDPLTDWEKDVINRWAANQFPE
jgi:hypothetical protein